ncbi:MAG: MerR family transcriptional regulator [Deltaproteobacteria bacterium]|nr:MerR family transcriptional regulator [Deltaproteobacteria bacterium]
MELEKPVKIPDRMFFRIGEVARIAGVKPYVLRFWETEFPFLAPGKGGNQQRMYSRLDVENTLLVKHLLHVQRFSIEGAKKRLSEMRRHGEMAEARKPKFAMTPEKMNLLDRARREAAELVRLCRLDQ